MAAVKDPHPLPEGFENGQKGPVHKVCGGGAWVKTTWTDEGKQPQEAGCLQCGARFHRSWFGQPWEEN